MPITAPGTNRTGHRTTEGGRKHRSGTIVWGSALVEWILEAVIQRPSFGRNAHRRNALSLMVCFIFYARFISLFLRYVYHLVGIAWWSWWFRTSCSSSNSRRKREIEWSMYLPQKRGFKSSHQMWLNSNLKLFNLVRKLVMSLVDSQSQGETWEHT